MRIGIVGLGKLGLPVALAIESKGHTVSGFDINPDVAQYLKERKIPYQEKDLQSLLDKTSIQLESVEDIVKHSDIIFCAVQTPHSKEYEGVTRVPNERIDFNYEYLVSAIKNVADIAKQLQKQTTLVVISTCLPGTYRREIEPLLNEYIDYVYNPFFIAMGTVLDDFLNPEFVLIGRHNLENGTIVEKFYSTIHSKEFMLTDITTAEAIKVSYNTFITMKTVLANTWGELAHKLGAKVDDIYKAWSMSTDRLISPKYLKAGVGDGGGCHPRDNIALSYIAKKVGLSHDIFEDLMYAREDHMAWLADEAVGLSKGLGLPLVILGRSFKPETNIETGSPAVLMANIIESEHKHPFTHEEDVAEATKAIYIIGTRHDRYKNFEFPEGSVVIDPFRYIKGGRNIGIVRIGG